MDPADPRRLRRAWLASLRALGESVQGAFGAALGAAFRAHPVDDVHAAIMATDRRSGLVPIRKWMTAIGYSATSLVFVGTGFSTPPGGAQLLLLAVGVILAAGTSGPAGAMVVNLTAEPIRATAPGTLTLANNRSIWPRARSWSGCSPTASAS